MDRRPFTRNRTGKFGKNGVSTSNLHKINFIDIDTIRWKGVFKTWKSDNKCSIQEKEDINRYCICFIIIRKKSLLPLYYIKFAINSAPEEVEIYI